jgi:D-3-phosphoglycerate dehydrogenase
MMQADFISFHVPLTNDTKHMIGAQQLQSMRKGTVLLNFARDGIIDNQALLEALHANHIHIYVSDFPSDLLKNHPRVISLPHLGASTKEAEDNCATMISKAVRDYLEHGAIIHSANFPSVDISPHADGVRLAIVNANVPNMVAQISAKLARAELNIASLLNKSREEIAYTLIDISYDVDDGVMREIASIPGILQCRKLPPLLNQTSAQQVTVLELGEEDGLTSEFA